MSRNKQVDWLDMASVVRYAYALKCDTAQVVFFNGRNYQITHVRRIAEIRREGYVVKQIIPGYKDGGR